MNKKAMMKKSQIVMASLLASLLIITPLLSSSVRPTYLYFVINILIIALGAEAGLLSSAFSKPPEDQKTPPFPPPAADHQATNEHQLVPTKSASEKLPAVAAGGSGCGTEVVKAIKKVKKCPSTPSLFFIGSCADQNDVDHHDQAFRHGVLLHEEEEEEEFQVEEEGVGGLSGQELFTKAEMFIGNFYKQLKMQREDSWKRIHGFYQKAF